jgi:hypothetical protein
MSLEKKKFTETETILVSNSYCAVPIIVTTISASSSQNFMTFPLLSRAGSAGGGAEGGLQTTWLNIIFNSVLDPDPTLILIQSGQWIRIRIRNPDPGRQKQ